MSFSFRLQVTLPWALLFAVLGILCRMPGVLYQSSKAGVACGRIIAHVCLVKVGGKDQSLACFILLSIVLSACV